VHWCNEVVNECPDRHFCINTACGEGFTSAPLIPVDDGEVLLQRLCVFPHQREPRRAGSAVNKQNDWICGALGTNENPLLGAVDGHLLEDGKAVRVPANVHSRG
jgi:hypothetical protein